MAERQREGSRRWRWRKEFPLSQSWMLTMAGRRSWILKLNPSLSQAGDWKPMTWAIDATSPRVCISKKLELGTGAGYLDVGDLTRSYTSGETPEPEQLLPSTRGSQCAILWYAKNEYNIKAPSTHKAASQPWGSWISGKLCLLQSSSSTDPKVACISAR